MDEDAPKRKLPPWGFIEYFLIVQSTLSALLFFPGTQALRVPIRMAPFLLSLAPLVTISQKTQFTKMKPHPAVPCLMMAMGWLALMVFHPTTNTVLAGCAQATLYLAIMAPVFWSPYFLRSPSQLGRILVIGFVWSSINTIVGFLQVLYPDTFMPREFSQVLLDSQFGLAGLLYMGPDGTPRLRPPGLSDSPGAACGAGQEAALLGLIFLAAPISLPKKIVCLGMAILGITLIYITQVRSSMLLLAGMLLIYSFWLATSRWKGRALVFFGGMAVIFMLSLPLAIQLGGEGIYTRFATLFAKDPLTIYNESGRGTQLSGSLTRMIFHFPFGAGLGRWGMMLYYFGNPLSVDAPPIWAEVQIPAWILDGGIVLVVLYITALLITALQQWRLLRWMRGSMEQFWVAGFFAQTIGKMVVTFSYTPFTSQGGIDFWFMAGILHGAAYLLKNERRKHEDLPAG